MIPNKLKPRKSLNKAYLKVKPNRSDIEVFKSNLIQLIDQTNDTESEEFHKNLVSDFLKKTYYNPDHFINTKGRNDLVIHNGKDAQSTVGVIIEAKKPTNKTEMLRTDKLNTKAFQELMLYYLRERITQKNLEIKYLIATNISEWFVFDANVFEKHFAQNKKLVKQFDDFEGGRLTGRTTDFFYKEIAEPFIEQLDNSIDFTHFDLHDYVKPLRNDDKKERPDGKAGDNKLIALFKLLSPEHLLKLPFANDSNSLDKKFYSELLHLIGLTETKDGGKKIIQRNKNGQRNTASLLENAIIQVDTLDKIHRLENPRQYGNTMEDRLFNVGLELTITWVNRVLFLKLLESQLIAYHKGDQSYSFLNFKKINNYDDLNTLFFQVLARKHHERNEDIKESFAKVPYLNSSLFEPNELEHNTIFISNLRDEKKLPILSNTVLKDENGKKRTCELNTLEYFFAFLEAYDFSSEGAEDIQEENKTLINASVLGLIFEKINGYKDGSFFTPGFITMYMCRETIRRSVVQKFRDAGYQLSESLDLSESFDELYDKIDDRQKANDIINSLKICDPAVGSGHFLVSALNEIIAIKSDLEILQDRNGRRLKNYTFEVVNDDLVVTDEDGELFEYTLGNKEAQRVQEALFHEKQTIIENCLFGVDINPNSVKICRLRLWIELLKNAYYVQPSKSSEPLEGALTLETLPNIDINIKCGNSLISRFDLDADIKDALKKSKWTIDSYRVAVDSYRNAQSKEEKHEMERLINDIKSDFRSEVSKKDPKLVKLYKLNGELANLTTQTSMFEMSAKEKKYWNKKVEKLTKNTRKLETEIEDIKNNKIYENAFEWRFEFPEVLNDEGDFVGFDTVIGNPPYIRIQEINVDPKILEFYSKTYYSAGSGNYDIYIPFIELAQKILNQSGNQAYIIPHKFTNAKYGEKIRELVTKNQSLRKVLHFGVEQVFEDATTYTGVFFFCKLKVDHLEYYLCSDFSKIDKTDLPFSKVPIENFTNSEWIFVTPKEALLLEKISHDNETLENRTKRIYQGLKTSADKIFILELLEQNDDEYLVLCKGNNKKYSLEKGILKRLIKGGDSRKFTVLSSNLVILFPYNNDGLIPTMSFKTRYPKCWNFLKEHEYFLRNREKGKFNNDKWYQYGRNQAIDVISKPKLFTPDIAPSSRFSFDRDGELCFTGGAAGGYGIIAKDATEFLYLLTILNSNITNWYISKVSTQMRGGWYSFESRYIKNVSIPIYSQEQKNSIDLIANKIIALKKENPNADTSDLEAQIDQLVYGLYGLTEEEIKIVEEGVK